MVLPVRRKRRLRRADGALVSTSQMRCTQRVKSLSPRSLSCLKSPSHLKLLHITKCGGSALEAWGKAHGFAWGRHWLVVKEALKRGLLPPMEGRMKCEPWHIPPCFFRRNPYAGRHVVAVVRDPYTRLISEFRCPWKGLAAPTGLSAKRQDRRRSATPADLNEWLQEKLRSGAATAPFRNGHLIPQSLYLCSLGIMAATDATIGNHDAGGSRPRKTTLTILRFERLGADFKQLAQQYGLPDADDLPVKNESEMRRFTIDDLAEVTRRLIEDVYANDFTLFGYKKLPPAR